MLSLGVWSGAFGILSVHAQQPAVEVGRTLVGIVQNQDLRRVPQASVQVKDQEGTVIVTAVANEAGEFTVELPSEGTYSVSAQLDTDRSEYLILKSGAEPVGPVTLTLAKTNEISLEVVSLLAPIQYKASSETYALSRKEIESLPRGNNNDLQDVLLTIPGVVYGSLKQVHIRQDHANLQLRIDGVPIPDTVSFDVFGCHQSSRLGSSRHHSGRDGSAVWQQGGGGVGYHDEERNQAGLRIGADDGRLERHAQSVIRIWRNSRRKIPVLYFKQPYGDEPRHRTPDAGPFGVPRPERTKSDVHPRRLPA
ncbi:MAG: carboxypeptidase-like regulatory domain-containing protein [Nitrospira sp.]